MKKKLTVGLAAIAVASTALGICYVASKQNCPNYGTTQCPVGGYQGSDIQCTTEDKEDLNTTTGTGYYLTNSSGVCRYDCFYPDPPGADKPNLLRVGHQHLERLQT